MTAHRPRKGADDSTDRPSPWILGGEPKVLVDWEKYAGGNTYDTLARHNPEYSAVLRCVLLAIENQPLPAAPRIVELGGGTGNLAALLAASFPKGRVLLLDSSPRMLREALEKRSRQGLSNLQALRGDMRTLPFGDSSVDAVLYVHSLYSIPMAGSSPAGQTASLRESWRILRPGGVLVIADIGRIVPVWRLAWRLFFHNARSIGLFRTLVLYVKHYEALRQNRHIQQDQRRGVLWTHEMGELERLLREAGFRDLREQRSDLYFGLDDFVVARRSMLTGGEAS